MSTIFDKLTLIHVMYWFHQPWCYYLNQYYLRSTCPLRNDFAMVNYVSLVQVVRLAMFFFLWINMLAMFFLWINMIFYLYSSWCFDSTGPIIWTPMDCKLMPTYKGSASQYIPWKNCKNVWSLCMIYGLYCALDNPNMLRMAIKVYHVMIIAHLGPSLPTKIGQNSTELLKF